MKGSGSLLLLFQLSQYYPSLILSTSDETLVQCHTTTGDIILTIYSSWAPIGAKRFLDLVNDNYFTGMIHYNISSFLAPYYHQILLSIVVSQIS
jgi:hypothetical protein